tara:strand:- start:5528 stop:6040 length:513 start_codon:yes stop_codon:yes gene_type:complete
MAEETTENSYLDSMLLQLENADISNPAAMKVKMLLDMLPSEDKSAGENVLDIVSMIPGIGSIKAAEPILEMMTPAMRGMMKSKQGQAKSRKTTGVLPGKFTGGSRLNTETRESVMDFYKETKGGAFLENLSDETLTALNANKAKIIAAATRDKQSSRQGLKRIIELMGWD